MISVDLVSNRIRNLRKDSMILEALANSKIKSQPRDLMTLVVLVLSNNNNLLPHSIITMALELVNSNSNLRLHSIISEDSVKKTKKMRRPLNSLVIRMNLK